MAGATQQEAQAGYENVDPLAVGASALAGEVTPSSEGGEADTSLLTHPAQEKAEAKAFKAKEASKAAAQKQQAADKAEIEAVQNSPWTRLGNSLAQQFQDTETPVAAAVSGSQIPAAQQSAASTALSALGLSPGSSAASWLSGQTAAAQAESAPVAQAMAQEGAQYSAEAKPLEEAVSAFGQANALAEETAPEASWLNALASHVTSNLSYYGLVPTADLPGLSPSVAQALKESGGYPGTTGAGTTQLQNIVSNPSGTGSQVSKTAQNALAGSTPGTGSIPSPSAAPGG